jgi:hypothetical protein
MSNPEKDLEERVQEILKLHNGRAWYRHFSRSTSDPNCPIVTGWVLSRMFLSDAEKVQLRDLGFRPRGGRWMREDLHKNLRKDRNLTRGETEKAIDLLVSLVDGSGCSFSGSREFQGGTCAQENGRGLDCFFCSTRAFLRSVGVDPERKM